jgi:biotin carboxylase
MRRLFAAAHLPSPEFCVYPRAADPSVIGASLTYPVVVKPLCMSASRGVIRADDPVSFVEAFRRLRELLEHVDGSPGCNEIIVEQYIPGAEIEVEGILSYGTLKVLALLDKPDPLEGPFFEETILITPSRLSAAVQQASIDCTARAAAALGLNTGPVHAELRINDSGPWLLEIAPRSIGGHCSKALVFDVGTSLEELILRHALGLDIASAAQQTEARGVMMIPIPKAGVLRRVCGIEAAEQVPLIEGVTIAIPIGHPVVPLPEGSSYLGFIFGRGGTADALEHALRQSHAQLHFDIGDAIARTEVRIF